VRFVHTKALETLTICKHDAYAALQVASLQASGRKMDGSLVDKEVEAQAKRARALAHLQQHSCGPSSLERTGLREKTGLEDNTLEVNAVSAVVQ
jgi:hypothetical protein